MSLDSSHWYLPDGTPFYSVRARDGTERSVTLRDARKVMAVPSVTTILRIIAKPQLERWKRAQTALAALTLPRIDGECSEALLRRIEADAEQQVKAAAEEGTRIHDAIEQAFREGEYHAAYGVHVNAARSAIRKSFPAVRDWRPEESFAHELGFGGRVDLHSPSTGIIIDYKGKDGDFSDGKKLAYDQHEQLAGYSLGLNLPLAQCANLFVSRTHPGAVSMHIWTIEEMEWARGAFLRALHLWKWRNRYFPILQPRSRCA